MNERAQIAADRFFGQPANGSPVNLRRQSHQPSDALLCGWVSAEKSNSTLPRDRLQDEQVLGGLHKRAGRKWISPRSAFDLLQRVGEAVGTPRDSRNRGVCRELPRSRSKTHRNGGDEGDDQTLLAPRSSPANSKMALSAPSSMVVLKALFMRASYLPQASGGSGWWLRGKQRRWGAAGFGWGVAPAGQLRGAKYHPLTVRSGVSMIPDRNPDHQWATRAQTVSYSRIRPCRVGQSKYRFRNQLFCCRPETVVSTADDLSWG